jgi:hypothetical protein
MKDIKLESSYQFHSGLNFARKRKNVPRKDTKYHMVITKLKQELNEKD